MTGLELVVSIRERLDNNIPAIVLTGDISTETLRDIARQNCIQLNKPVKLPHLMQLVQELLPSFRRRPSSNAQAADAHQRDGFNPVIFVIDDNMQVREGIRSLLEDVGRTVQDYATAEAFLEAYDPAREGCLLVDAYLPGMSGVELLERLHAEGHRPPAIIITGDSDVPIALQAMKAGALDFIEKPIAAKDLLASIDLALEHSRDTSKLLVWEANAARLVSGLTRRQREVMDLVLAGHPSKNIAADLGISQRTVETHRASIMKKTGSKSLPALARVALAAAASSATVAHQFDETPGTHSLAAD
jgi:two-component system CheB/CheR fusion protein